MSFLTGQVLKSQPPAVGFTLPQNCLDLPHHHTTPRAAERGARTGRREEKEVGKKPENRI